jgi:cobalt/nickel transport system permease protein
MHMSDALLSPAVGIGMYVAGAAACGYTVKKIKRDDLCEKKVPVMGVMGAFVFAAQMVNIAIPATGSSGHICGGVLLAAVIGGRPALLSMSAVLIIQCLFFADGGLLALGCNIFNMGVIPCLVAYPLIFEPFVKKGMTAGRITAASIAAAVASLQLGAFSVVLETLFSGVTALPFATFLLLMQPIHLAIGIAEGIITATILCFIYKVRPEIMESTLGKAAIRGGVPVWKVLAVITISAIFIGGILSMFTSSCPDGLEWAIEKTAGTAELEASGLIAEKMAQIQNAVAIMPDYEFKSVADGEDNAKTGTATAGIAGGAFTFLLAGVTALAISAVKKTENGKRHIENGLNP